MLNDDLLILFLLDWCERGGIVGRGVLVDYVGYLEDKGLPVPDPTTNYGFTTHDLDAVARHQGLDFKTGDILFIRTGFVRWYDNAPEQERQRCMGGEKSTFIGLQGSEEAKEWLWDHYFAAVACDTFGFEVNPPTEVVLHETILPLWGTPIGEMFNLEQLADMCRQQQRWSFFVTSAPLNVPNGIGSPPNIIAIF
jgi:kynurenine formamidase